MRMKHVQELAFIYQLKIGSLKLLCTSVCCLDAKANRDSINFIFSLNACSNFIKT